MIPLYFKSKKHFLKAQRKKMSELQCYQDPSEITDICMLSNIFHYSLRETLNSTSYW